MNTLQKVVLELDDLQVPAVKRALAYYLCMHREPTLVRTLEQLERVADATHQHQ